LIERFQDSPNGAYLIGPESLNSRPPLDCCGVLVSRHWNLEDRTCVTLVDGAHPIAVKGICELLTKERALSTRLADLPQLDASSVFSRSFQLLFVVWLSPNQSRCVRVKLVQFNSMQKRKAEPEFGAGKPSRLRSAIYLLSKKPPPPEGIIEIPPRPGPKLRPLLPTPPRTAPRPGPP
jgi:hypothetical protein